jgi:hypothetical protein
MGIDLKPVRKIKNSHNSAIRGTVSSKKNNRLIDFESALERDFIYLLEFEDSIESFVEQPICIEFEYEGQKRKYTPDFFVKYMRQDQPPMLVEIKYRNDIRENWKTLKPKFKAAKQYALFNGWIFKIYTEIEIREAYLDNVKFLLNYRNNVNLPNQKYKAFILNILNEVQETTPNKVLSMASNDSDTPINIIPTLWNMVSQGLIGCFLDKKLTMESSIWGIKN